MKLQQLMSFVRRAIDDFQMIEEGDKIAVGISGGKDSLALLYALNGLKRFYPKKFDIVFEQLAIYFVYRHFANFDISSCASFVCLSVKFIRAICASILLREKLLSVLDIAEVARMYSSEIEYSDENLYVILSAF